VSARTASIDKNVEIASLATCLLTNVSVVFFGFCRFSGQTNNLHDSIFPVSAQNQFFFACRGVYCSFSFLEIGKNLYYSGAVLFEFLLTNQNRVRVRFGFLAVVWFSSVQVVMSSFSVLVLIST